MPRYFLFIHSSRHASFTVIPFFMPTKVQYSSASVQRDTPLGCNHREILECKRIKASLIGWLSSGRYERASGPVLSQLGWQLVHSAYAGAVSCTRVRCTFICVGPSLLTRLSKRFQTALINTHLFRSVRKVIVQTF